jgi:hypothetical protein
MTQIDWYPVIAYWCDMLFCFVQIISIGIFSVVQMIIIPNVEHDGCTFLYELVLFTAALELTMVVVQIYILFYNYKSLQMMTNYIYVPIYFCFIPFATMVFLYFLVAHECIEHQDDTLLKFWYGNMTIFLILLIIESIKSIQTCMRCMVRRFTNYAAEGEIV